MSFSNNIRIKDVLQIVIHAYLYQIR